MIRVRVKGEGEDNRDVVGLGFEGYVLGLQNYQKIRVC